MKISSFVVRSLSARSFSTRAMSLIPPKLPGLVLLDREKFTKTFSVPTITFNEAHNKSLKEIIKNLKKFLIKVERFQPVSNGKIRMNPDLVRSWEDLPHEELEKHGIGSGAFSLEDVEFGYQNWRADELVKAITPEGLEPATSYSKIGHIIHINLKDNLLPYKTVIGEIYKDKIPGCRAVINKAQSIDNTFRNFQIDLLAGDADYQVQLKENGINFEFDFSTVYWNSRLSTEHERLVKLLNPNDVLYDVFAGVGPFAVPSGKKRVKVLANDLNPHSYKWLEHNVAKNKVSGYVRTFNKDGRDFILENVREHLLERIEKRGEEMKEYSIHIAMNLPGLAVTFLDAFVGLLKDNERSITDSESIPVPICHCYCFVKGVDDPKEMAQLLAEENIGFKLVKGDTLKDIYFVRNVAPNKDMMRVDILLTSSVLFGTISAKRSPGEALNSIPNKKRCN
jgi:tRNA (guanine37-N1)-methyltransferase